MRYHFLLPLPLVAHLAAAQVTDTAAARAGATIDGRVVDSLAHGPLAGATVQIASADGASRFSRSAVSDSAGHFELGGVPDGRYLLGFFHPTLDSLGIEAPLHTVVVAGHQPVHADVAIPSAARLRAAICGARPDTAGAVIVGIVRDAADGMPVAAAQVAAQWIELAFTTKGLRRTAPRVVAASGANGWFAVCDVPRSGTTTLVATLGADSTARVDVEVPADGFARRELYVPRRQAAAATASRIAITGSALTAVGGRPLAGAVVRIDGAGETRTNERGVWTVPQAALGTRMLEIRAVGYYPVRRAVDVVPGAAPVRVTLVTLRSVLDTFLVTAKMAHQRERAGFAARQRSTAGRFFTASDIARLRPQTASKLFMNMPGVRIGFATDTLATLATPYVPVDMMRDVDRRVLMRGILQQWCAPAMFVDGVFLPELNADDLDALLEPEQLAGVEVYTRATAPPQFVRPLNECGAVVIWQK